MNLSHHLPVGKVSTYDPCEEIFCPQWVRKPILVQDRMDGCHLSRWMNLRAFLAHKWILCMHVYVPQTSQISLSMLLHVTILYAYIFENLS